MHEETEAGPPPGRGDLCAGSNGSSLDCGRVSHLGMDDQSVRSKGEPLRTIERLAGSGHCAERRGLVLRQRFPMKNGGAVCASWLRHTLHPCGAGTGGDDRRTSEGELPTRSMLMLLMYRYDYVDVWLLCWTRVNDTGWHDHDIPSWRGARGARIAARSSAPGSEATPPPARCRRAHRSRSGPTTSTASSATTPSRCRSTPTRRRCGGWASTRSTATERRDAGRSATRMSSGRSRTLWLREPGDDRLEHPVGMLV